MTTWVSHLFPLPPIPGRFRFCQIDRSSRLPESASLTPGFLEAEGGRRASLLSCLGNRAYSATERWGMSLNYNSLMFGEGFKAVLAG